MQLSSPASSLHSHTELPQDVVFRAKLLTIDHYYASPGTLDRSYSPFLSPEKKLKECLILRIFAITAEGNKVCVHLHQAYPYFFIPYKGPVNNVAAVQSYIYHLGISINQALAVALGKQNESEEIKQYVASIIIVKGIPFYGFHDKVEYFFKIYLLKPEMQNRIADLLQSGAILGEVIQPFESHIPFYLQFMMDYNVSGMGYLMLNDVRYRINEADITETPFSWSNKKELIKQSRCEIELDSTLMNVVNRRDIQERSFIKGGNYFPFTEDTEYVPSLKDIWKDENERRKLLGLPVTEKPKKYFPSPSTAPKLKNEMLNMVQSMNDRKESANSYNLDTLFDIPSVFQSVEALYPTQENEEIMSSIDTIETSNSENKIKYQDEKFTQNRQDLVSSGTKDLKPEVDETVILSQNLTCSQESLALQFSKEMCDEENLIEEGILKNSSLADDYISDDSDSALNDLLDIQKDEAMLSEENIVIPQLDGESSFSPGEEDISKKKKRRKAPPTIEKEFTSARALNFDSIDAWIAHESKRSRGLFYENNITKLWSPKKEQKRNFDIEHPTPLSPTMSRKIIATPEENKMRKKCLKDPIMLFKHFQKKSRMFYFELPPELRNLTTDCLRSNNIEEVNYVEPYYSSEKGKKWGFKAASGENERKNQIFPEKPKRCWGKEQRHFNFIPPTFSIHRDRKNTYKKRQWTLALPIPLPFSTSNGLKSTGTLDIEEEDLESEEEQPIYVSQIEAPTPMNTFGFKFTQTKGIENSKSRSDKLSVISLEIHASSRIGFSSDPEIDKICCLFYFIQMDKDFENGSMKSHVGMIQMCPAEEELILKRSLTDITTTTVTEELDLFHAFFDILHMYDPDILTGYEVHGSSWGYLIERGRALGLDVLASLSRVYPENIFIREYNREQDMWGYRKATMIRVIGRIVLNIWRHMRSELNLYNYSYQNIVYHVLHQRVPYYSVRTLSEWYNNPKTRWRTCKYFLEKVIKNIDLLEQINLIQKTSEFAKTFGMDFMSVIVRGSQYRVEAFMCRIARPENFVMISPSRTQVAQMRAAECLPLVMEPLSTLYTSPVVVLDFQSLYPSIMIAYNYCFSTVLGKVGPTYNNSLGVTSVNVEKDKWENLKENIHVSPNRVAFVDHKIRKGLLGRMLSEFLDTRVMVKGSMKLHSKDRGIQKLLDARQLSLKLTANVTYGYTAASFSGRMPCVEIADSIVQKARETLENTIDLIHNHPKWNAKVVYGDTDSVFVLLKGASKDTAFRIGREIAEVVTKANPDPVILKFEKVYLPSVLLTKKRYVGFKYETEDQKKPVFDAKGIETIRRDTCPAVAKIMEKCLKILFRTKNLTLIQKYLYHQWNRILTDRISVQDFMFSKEVKLGTYSHPQYLPPAAIVATKQMANDRRAEPQYGERVRYVVVYGAKADRLMDLVVSPEEYYRKGLRLNGEYYIRKQIIPSLSRIFSLIGIDIESWYNKMPKVIPGSGNISLDLNGFSQEERKNKTIDYYYTSKQCTICREECNEVLCSKCREEPSGSVFTAQSRLQMSQSSYSDLKLICKTCMSSGSGLGGHFQQNQRADIESLIDPQVSCESMECPIFHRRVVESQRCRKLKKASLAVSLQF